MDVLDLSIWRNTFIWLLQQESPGQLGHDVASAVTLELVAATKRKVKAQSRALAEGQQPIPLFVNLACLLFYRYCVGRTVQARGGAAGLPQELLTLDAQVVAAAPGCLPSQCSWLNDDLKTVAEMSVQRMLLWRALELMAIEVGLTKDQGFWNNVTDRMQRSLITEIPEVYAGSARMRFQQLVIGGLPQIFQHRRETTEALRSGLEAVVRIVSQDLDDEAWLFETEQYQVNEYVSKFLRSRRAKPFSQAFASGWSFTQADMKSLGSASAALRGSSPHAWLVVMISKLLCLSGREGWERHNDVIAETVMLLQRESGLGAQHLAGFAPRTTGQWAYSIGTEFEGLITAAVLDKDAEPRVGPAILARAVQVKQRLLSALLEWLPPDGNHLAAGVVETQARRALLGRLMVSDLGLWNELAQPILDATAPRVGLAYLS